MPLTVGAIAARLGVPVHRVRYAITTRGIRPTCRASGYRLFAEDDVPRIAAALNEMGASREDRVLRLGGEVR
jgi:DNA-binding transcriptional MerR regulator